MAAGALDILGNVALVFALQTGDLLLLAILAPAAPIFTAIIGRVFLRELMTRWQILGLVVASAALVLASL
jgi:drug/metabolite transporter (DMT)-like permease